MENSMKKILLSLMFIAVLSSVEIEAQTVFIPQPPVINIPLLDPSRMIIQNEVIRNTTSGEAGKGKKGASTNVPKAIDYTVFTESQENVVPKILARGVKGSADSQLKSEAFFDAQIDMYKRTAAYHKYPANDVAFAYIYFVSNTYEIYKDLVTVPLEKDPWAKRAKDGFERISLMNLKKISKIMPGQDKAMYFQFKEMLSAKPEFKKLSDLEKQKMTETLAIKFGVLYADYMKAIESEDQSAINDVHEAAKRGFEELLNMPIDKVEFSYEAGVRVK